MKVIIAGPRDISDYSLVVKLMNEAAVQGIFPTEVISGKAKGVDTLGEKWAYLMDIPVKEFPADWTKYRKAAGHIRNAQMGDYAKQYDGALCALYHDESRGSKNMIEYAEKIGLRVVKMKVEVPEPLSETHWKPIKGIENRKVE